MRLGVLDYIKPLAKGSTCGTLCVVEMHTQCMHHVSFLPLGKYPQIVSTHKYSISFHLHELRDRGHLQGARAL